MSKSQPVIETWGLIDYFPLNPCNWNNPPTLTFTRTWSKTFQEIFYNKVTVRIKTILKVAFWLGIKIPVLKNNGDKKSPSPKNPHLRKIPRFKKSPIPRFSKNPQSPGILIPRFKKIANPRDKNPQIWLRKIFL